MRYISVGLWHHSLQLASNLHGHRWKWSQEQPICGITITGPCVAGPDHARLSRLRICSDRGLGLEQFDQGPRSRIPRTCTPLRRRYLPGPLRPPVNLCRLQPTSHSRTAFFHLSCSVWKSVSSTPYTMLAALAVRLTEHEQGPRRSPPFIFSFLPSSVKCVAVVVEMNMASAQATLASCCCVDASLGGREA